MLAHALRIIPFTRRDEQERSNALEGFVQSFGKSEVSDAELEALGFEAGAVVGGAGGGDDGSWWYGVGGEEMVQGRGGEAAGYACEEDGGGGHVDGGVCLVVVVKDDQAGIGSWRMLMNGKTL